jgi:hypothetical protein
MEDPVAELQQAIDRLEYRKQRIRRLLERRHFSWPREWEKRRSRLRVPPEFPVISEPGNGGWSSRNGSGKATWSGPVSVPGDLPNLEEIIL